jgi:hypothetical protein
MGAFITLKTDIGSNSTSKQSRQAQADRMGYPTHSHCTRLMERAWSGLIMRTERLPRVRGSRIDRLQVIIGIVPS